MTASACERLRGYEIIARAWWLNATRRPSWKARSSPAIRSDFRSNHANEIDTRRFPLRSDERVGSDARACAVWYGSEMRALASILACFALACGGSSQREGGSGGSAGNDGAGGAPDGSTCAASCLDEGFTCCGSTCVNLDNDPHHCGRCGNACPTPHPFCDFGTCGEPACFSVQACGSTEPCCGDACCAGLCCALPGPPAVVLQCVDPSTTDGTCPRG